MHLEEKSYTSNNIQTLKISIVYENISTDVKFVTAIAVNRKQKIIRMKHLFYMLSPFAPND